MLASLIRLGGESIIIPIGSSVALEEEEDSRREYTDRKKEEKKKEVGSSFSDLVSECHPPLCNSPLLPTHSIIYAS